MTTKTKPVLIAVSGGVAHILAGDELVDLRDFDGDEEDEDAPEEFTDAEIAAAERATVEPLPGVAAKLAEALRATLVQLESAQRFAKFTNHAFIADDARAALADYDAAPAPAVDLVNALRLCRDELAQWADHDAADAATIAARDAAFAALADYDAKGASHE